MLQQPTSSGLQRSLESDCYTAPSFFDREKEELFSREWVCAGREEDLPDNESAIVIELLGESIIVARLKGGRLRAHYNVCRHRGARLCASDSKWGLSLNGGISRKYIRCPYHQWTYGLDGRLIGAPHLSRQPNFDASQFNLYPVGVGTWGGFIFLKMSPADGEIEQQELGSVVLGHAPDRLKNYPLNALKTVRSVSYDVAANWKLIAENYNECYHCGGVHPELCEVVPDFRKGGGGGLDWEKGIPHREGAWTYTFSGTSDRNPFPGLDEHERVRHKGELIYPNLMLSMSADHGTAFLLWPLSPDRTRVECRYLFAAEEMANTNFDPSDAIDFWDITNRQDWAVCERVQQGLGARVHKHGFYAPMEDESLDIRRYLAQRLGD